METGGGGGCGVGTVILIGGGREVGAAGWGRVGSGNRHGGGRDGVQRRVCGLVSGGVEVVGGDVAGATVVGVVAVEAGLVGGVTG